MVEVPVAKEDRVNRWRGWVELVDALDLGEDSEFLKASFAFGREERRRIELFLHGVGHAEVEKHPRAAVMEEDFVSADFVYAAVECEGCRVLNHAFPSLAPVFFGK